VDTRFINAQTAAQIETDRANQGDFDALGNTRNFINLGNVNGGNTDDITDQTREDEVYTSDGFLRSIMFVSVGSFTSVIERIADARAENGAEQSRLGMVDSLLMQNQTNLEAAHGRIMDADVALESSRFARQNVLVQSSAAMVAQANQLTSIALQILG
jgi:flagellin-like hook-associated protein FlgL